MTISVTVKVIDIPYTFADNVIIHYNTHDKFVNLSISESSLENLQNVYDDIKTNNGTISEIKISESDTSSNMILANHTVPKNNCLLSTVQGEKNIYTLEISATYS